MRVAGMGTSGYGYGLRWRYPSAFEQVQKHIFWTKTEGDIANFAKFTKIGYMYLLHFWAVLDIFGLILTGKPVRVMGTGTCGSGTGCCGDTHGNTHAIA